MLKHERHLQTLLQEVSLMDEFEREFFVIYQTSKKKIPNQLNLNFTK